MSTGTERPPDEELKVNPFFNMTLRDYYAGLALQGLLSNSGLKGKAEEFAHDAYVHAHHMLEQRKIHLK